MWRAGNHCQYSENQKLSGLSEQEEIEKALGDIDLEELAEEDEIIFPGTDTSNPSLSEIVTGQFLTSTISVEDGEDVKDEDNVTEVIDKPVDIRVSEPRELVLPEA